MRTKWDEGGNKPKKPKFRFLGYNSLGLHFQDSRVVLNDSAVKNGWGIVFTDIFRHKQGSNERKLSNANSQSCGRIILRLGFLAKVSPLSNFKYVESSF